MCFWRDVFFFKHNKTTTTTTAEEEEEEQQLNHAIRHDGLCFANVLRIRAASRDLVSDDVCIILAG